VTNPYLQYKVTLVWQKFISKTVFFCFISQLRVSAQNAPSSCQLNAIQQSCNNPLHILTNGLTFLWQVLLCSFHENQNNSHD
jgi:hypothetical protein